MIRFSAVAITVSCLAAPLSVQAQTAPGPGVMTAANTTSSTPGKMASAESSGCGLGVIVAVGGEFEVQKIGLFTDEYKKVPIDKWGLSDLIFSRVRAATPPGIAVQRIPYSRESPPPEKPKGLFRDSRAELSEVIRQVTSGTHCRRYVVIGRSIDALDTTIHKVGGIGIVDWPLRHQTLLFALSFVRVFNGPDLTVIRQSSAFIEREPLLKRMLVGTVMLGPYRELDHSSFPSTPADAASNTNFREGVRAMLTASLDKILPAMLRP